MSKPDYEREASAQHARPETAARTERDVTETASHFPTVAKAGCPIGSSTRTPGGSSLLQTDTLCRPPRPQCGAYRGQGLTSGKCRSGGRRISIRLAVRATRRGAISGRRPKFVDAPQSVKVDHRRSRNGQSHDGGNFPETMTVEKRRSPMGLS